MGSSHRRRPATGGTARVSRNERSGDRLDYLNTPAGIAQQASSMLDDLEANGAKITYRAPAGALAPSFFYELRSGGDRQRCRVIIAEAKGRPLIWAALLHEIARRSGDVA